MGAMRTHYLDASAIVKLIVDEEGSDKIRTYFDGQSDFFTTSLCFAEALGVLKVKHLYRSEITQHRYLSATLQLFAQIQDKSIEIEQIDISQPNVFRAVKEIVQKYSIDVSDAFQVYTLKNGFSSIFKYESEPILITADSKLAQVARAEGLRAWDCLKEPEPNDK